MFLITWNLFTVFFFNWEFRMNHIPTVYSPMTSISKPFNGTIFHTHHSSSFPHQFRQHLHSHVVVLLSFLQSSLHFSSIQFNSHFFFFFIFQSITLRHKSIKISAHAVPPLPQNHTVVRLSLSLSVHVYI